MSVDGTLKNRHGIHGDYADQAQLSMSLVDDMENGRNWFKLTGPQKEALLLIAVKLGRILTGDHNTADHWHDIAGYATLVENILNGKQANGVVPPGDGAGTIAPAKESPKPPSPCSKQEFEAWKKFVWTRPTPHYPGTSIGDTIRGAWRIA